MSATINECHRQIVEMTVEQLLSRDQIETTAGKCGYSIQAHFFPRDFDDLCNEIAKLAMQNLRSNQHTLNGTSPKMPPGIEEFTRSLIHDKLKKQCTIVNPSNVRNPPPQSLDLPDTWKWIVSWLYSSH